MDSVTRIDNELFKEAEGHLRNADPAVLIATLVSLTGDRKLLERYAPFLTYAHTIHGPASSLAEHQRESLHREATAILQDGSNSESTADLDDAAFLAIATALTGKAPIESVGYLREQAGLRPSFPQTPLGEDSSGRSFKVIIIGAGMTGIHMGVALGIGGIDYKILERESGVGGVWWTNTYPGAGVDTSSKFYSYSYEINPEWVYSHPERDEFQEYLRDVSDKHGVTEKIRFGAEVTGMVWDATSSVWRVSYTEEDVEKVAVANAVITAAGYLNRGKLPEVEGIDSFSGESFHSSEWNDSVDLRGKRVAVVGTGCTSVQIVDSVVDQVSSLVVFQRQPHWVMPSDGRAMVGESERWLLKNVPLYANWARLHAYLPAGDANYDLVRFDENWVQEHGGDSINAQNDALRQACMRYLEESFPDRPDLKAKLTPPFPPLAKRPVRDPGGYFDALKRENCTLIASGVSRGTPEGILDGDGVRHPLDVIVYATGFHLEYLSGWRIEGQDGCLLSDVWGDSPNAYNGCLVPGFPNLFITSGPHASEGHGGAHNLIVEAVGNYIIECLRLIASGEAASLEPTETALRRWNEEVSALMKDTVWARETRAIHYARNTKGEVILVNPMRMNDYWERLREPNMDDLIVVRRTAQ
ncbi:flavin-containing monooxygenase [Microbacterium sp. AGC85]